MNLSTKGRYGLRAMCELADAYGGEPLSLSRIAENQNLSVRYLEQLFHLLRTGGYVISTRGAKGGYSLSRPPEEITVGEVLRVLDGDISPVGCGDTCADCIEPDICYTRPLWTELNQAVYQVMDNKTLDDLIKKEKI